MGTKTELKNMNSFRFIERGIKAEVKRQEGLLSSGGRVIQETLHFDPRPGAHPPITSLRSKEEAHDYRYFPEPDLVPVDVDERMLAEARDAMPELPSAKAERFERDLGLSADSARQLAFRADLGEYFEQALTSAGAAGPSQALANWVLVELASRLQDGEDATESRATPESLAALCAMVADRRVSVGAARQVLDRLVAGGGDPEAIVEAEGLAALDGGEELAEIVRAAIAANEDAAERIRQGNAKAIGPIVGYVMRETKGRADGGEVTKLVHEQLGA
jgi:aspartyl-tRNA(Asn)/glutamyl-tRNA(Gln) amidotransferase subunit B